MSVFSPFSIAWTHVHPNFPKKTLYSQGKKYPAENSHDNKINNKFKDVSPIKHVFFSIAMLLFGGVTLHPTSLATTPSTDGSFFFATKKQPTYYTVRSSSRRRSQQNTPTLLRAEFYFFFASILLMAFSRCKFSAGFFLDPFFGCPFNPLIDSLLSRFFGWNHW